MNAPGRRSLRSIADRLRTIGALGVGNVARVAAYRLLLRSRLHPVQRVRAVQSLHAPYFGAAAARRTLSAPSAWTDAANYFGWLRPPLSEAPPEWYQSPLSEAGAFSADAQWWTLPDFDPATGDVKAVWEASRFDWVLAFAQQAATGAAGALDRLNAWLDDWNARNPCYRGHNWKCAQEASIRVMHLASASLILRDTASPPAGLVDLLSAHLRRIRPTVSYAIGQANNHGTSEAAALFIGGSWLASLGERDGASWAAQGRALLERSAQRLVQPDGSFSQYSINYHRLMLETLSLAEVFRRHLRLEAFSAKFQGRAAAGARWLRALVDARTGEAPNYGANDGAHLLPLTDAGYRDYRPAVALATALFEGQRAFESAGEWQDHLAWLDVSADLPRAPPVAPHLFRDGGQAVLRNEEASALLVFPHYRFRPGHCDALHVDLAIRGSSVLRDAGTFSYAAEPEVQESFSGTRGHNTIQFDGREQMPILGRFLRGPWLPDASVGPIEVAESTQAVTAAYGDAAGARHERRVVLRRGSLHVRDRARGFRSSAVLRWRLRPGEWRVAGATATDGHHRIVVTADVPIARTALVNGWESWYYLRKDAVPVLEVEIARPGTLTTEYRWSD